MITKPTFSIITITLNNLEGLRKTHNSIKNLREDDFEWIIIDGASTDGTIKFLNDLNIPHISESDKGLYDAMNKGIDNAHGDYLIFMNAGDCFANADALSAINTSHTLDFIYGDALEVLEGQQITKKSRAHDKITQGMITHHQSMIYRRDAIGDQRYNLTYKIAADYDFTYRFIKRVKNIAYHPAPICIFESGGLSERNAAQGRKEQYKIRKNLKVAFFQNAKTYLQQMMIYKLRCLSPRLYWSLKRFATKP